MRDVQKLQVIAAKITRRDRVLDEIANLFAAVSFVAVLIATYGLDLSPGLF